MLTLIKIAMSAIIDPIKEIGALIRAGRAMAISIPENWPREPAASTENYQYAMSIFEQNGINIASVDKTNALEETIELPMTTTFLECSIIARAELMVAKSLLCREISNYPTPIAVCDCQFNHLLAERRRISDALCILGADNPVVNLKLS